MSSPRLVPDSVSVPFGNSAILQDLSLAVAEHEFVCVIGTSGAATITATIATMKQYKILSGPEPSEASIVNTGPITSVISKLGTGTGDPRWN